MRDVLANKEYFDEAIHYASDRIISMEAQAKEEGSDPTYLPQYYFEIAKKYWELMLLKYSRGDVVSELSTYFSPMLDVWEKSETLGEKVFTKEQQQSRNSWATNLDNYIINFWLVGLALTLEVPDKIWTRLVTLVGNEGEDELLDRIIASRQPSRKIGKVLCHPKPYKQLLD